VAGSRSCSEGRGGRVVGRVGGDGRRRGADEARRGRDFEPAFGFFGSSSHSFRAVAFGDLFLRFQGAFGGARFAFFGFE